MSSTHSPRRNLNLADLSFYGIGGTADEVWEIDDAADLAETWAKTIDEKCPKVILGKGSNTIFSDKGFRGRVFIPKFGKVKWSCSRSHPHLPSPVKGEELNSAREELHVNVEAGKNFQDFVEEASAKGFTDLCELSGIPGNFGGFIRGNAGAHGVEISDYCTEVQFADERGQIQSLPAAECNFNYRESIFKNKPDWAITSATLHLKNKETSPGAASRKTKETLAQRWQKNPSGRSGGCLFKNPPGKIAGKLLDNCGAKGDKIGNAQIAQDHANFFLNLGNATQADILTLAKKWHKIVLEKTGVNLELEVFVCDEVGRRISID